MDLETYTRRESMLRLRESLQQSEADIHNGAVHTIAETAAVMRQVITENAGADITEAANAGR